ncbi:tyrosine aminotransferase-like, partial [Sycon ciliatum]|uniref:tyrosine aminotransferase-like n=1 Tax=Sycon ciliatum TaxID=27933 RepID=UPI0031F645B5
MADTGSTESWSKAASSESTACVNPIRALADLDVYKANPEKNVLRLNIGDPGYFGNLPPAAEAVQAISDALVSGKHNGYAPTSGSPIAKQAVADKFSYAHNPITADDVYITVGCSQAMEFTVTSLCNPGTNILLARPGYPLYRTFCDSRGVEYRLFNLLPDRSWEVDIEQMESMINEKTRLIVLVNPSNPCGSSYSKEHLRQILDVAERHHLPILSDEVYGDVVYNGGEFYPLASLTSTVPVLTCRSLAKKYLAPGWRLGWLIVYDQHHRLDT